MKVRSSLITLCIGTILLSVSMLVKAPAHGTVNLSEFCLVLKNAAPVLMAVSCILIFLTATKMRMVNVIAMVLIVGSVVATHIIGESTGYSMGAFGWASGFTSILIVIPAGLFLCCLTGLVSLFDMMDKESAVIKPIAVSAAAILILGLAYHLIADRKPDIHGLVVSVLHNENETNRFSLARNLWEIRDDRLPPLLIALLEDQNPRVREAGAFALCGKSRNATAVRPLLRALDRETDGKTKEWIVRALGAVVPLAEPSDRTAAVESLIRILQQETGPIKGTTAEILGMIRDERAIRPLIDVLADKDADFFAHDALIAITGMRLERDSDAWNQWMTGKNHPQRVSQ